MKSTLFIFLLGLFILTACSNRSEQPKTTAESELVTEGMAVIKRSGLPGVLRSTYARVIRIDDKSFYQQKQAVIEGGPHQVQLECKVCDANLLIFKNCVTYLSDFLSVRLLADTEYEAKCDADLQREEIEFTLENNENGEVVAQHRRAAN